MDDKGMKMNKNLSMLARICYSCPVSQTDNYQFFRIAHQLQIGASRGDHSEIPAWRQLGAPQLVPTIVFDYTTTKN
jgi:hypothetical protein